MLIRDPVHGDLSLTPLEAAVLDLPAVQRLRGIKQLGTASYVYPGALHTRFDHSLGASALAHRIIAALRRDGVAIADDLAELVAIGTLLHDVTHVPFGHTLEDERRLFPRHDKGTRLGRLLDGELGAGLDRLGIRAPIAGLLGAAPSALPPWAAEVIASTIDADLLDYLRRDAYFTGLAHDYDDRVFRYFTVADGHLALSMAKHGMDRPDARSEVIQLLRMRYFLTERVYYHHTKVAAGAMISKAVELAVATGALAEPDLLALNDWTLLDRLAACGAAAAALTARLARRDLLKRGYVVSARSVDGAQRAALVRRFHESRAERHAAERLLAEQLGCAEGEVIVYCPALTVMKEASARVVTSRGLGALNDADEAGSAEIRALQERYAQLWRLYVFVPAALAERAAPLAAAVFGHASEHS
ncbi:HD domain-containing protein [bacterium]|nr:HD domain-containing protein [bacterium]